MIEGMGVQWAGTLLGCVAFLLVPMPVIFYYKGAQIRKKSAFAPNFDLAVKAAAPGDEGQDSSDGTRMASTVSETADLPGSEKRD